MDNYNATCIITGKQDNLQMKAVRDKKGNMVGWIFLSDKAHESIAEITWEIRPKFSGNVSRLLPTKIDNLS